MEDSDAVSMKRTMLVAGWALGLGLGASPPSVAHDGVPALVVDDDNVQCPDAAFQAIQDAVNAAPPGARVRVCAGTYDEQVVIDKPLRLRGENGATVRPSGMIGNTTNLFSGAPMAAVVLVTDTTDVVLERLAVDGAENGIAGCEPALVGVFYRNASGEVRNLAVRNLRLRPGLEGCQSGHGIFVQSGGGGISMVDIANSSIHDFQKNGITANEPGTKVRVADNVVTGLGPTTGAAQNGVQIGFGATGRLEGNSVVNHVWSPCVSPAACAFVATGVLVIDAHGVRIARNTVGRSQTGILLVGHGGSVDGNNVFDTEVFDGIALFGDHNRAAGNEISNSDEAAVFLQGDDNKVIRNRINEAPIGVWKFGGSANLIAANRFFNAPIPFLDPPPVAGPGGTPSPYR